MREKLIELQLQADIEDEVSENTTEHRGYIADLMLANGVIVLPCKVGDTVYTHTPRGTVVEFEISLIRLRRDAIELVHNTGVTLSPNEFGKTVFLTREEAEAKLESIRE